MNTGATSDGLMRAPVGAAATTTIVTAPAIVNPYIEPDTDDTFQLRKYWRAVRKRLWLLISISALITMLTAIYMARKPDIYQAKAQVQVDLENTPDVGGSKGSAVIVSSPVNDPAYFNTQLQILSSPSLMRRVVKTLDLENDKSFTQPRTGQNNSTWQNLRRMFGFGAAPEAEKNGDMVAEDVLTGKVAPATDREDLTEAKRLQPYVNGLIGGLIVDPVKEIRTSSYSKDTRLVDLRFRHQDPQVAARIVNAIADAFVYSNLERRTKNTLSTGDFLQERIAGLQSQIRNSEERLLQYARNNDILDLEADQNVVVSRLTGLNQQLLTAENARKLTEARYNAARVSGAATNLAEAAKGSGEAIETNLTNLRQRKEELLVRYQPEYPAVKAIDAQITKLESEKKNTTQRVTNVVLSNLETEYRQARAFEQQLRSAYNEQTGKMSSQNQAAIQYRIIQQEIETYKSLLAGLLQSDSQNTVVRAGTPNNVGVADYALASDYPVEPRRMRTVMMAFLFSIGLGIGLSIFMEYMDDTLHNAEDIESSLRLPAVAVIPQINGLSRRRLQPGSTNLQTRGTAAGNPDLLINADTRSPIAEAYRQLRTSVMLSTAGRPPKSLLVTSSFPSEGKTTTAINMALTLSQTGAKVIIIDADMRRPRLHTVFDLNNSNGLSTLLSSEMSEESVMDTIVDSPLAGSLNMLTAGRVPPNPAELLGSEQMRRLLRLLETHFDHIIIDSPPVASFTDGVLIASIVDGVLLVVHSGKSARGVAKRSKQILLDVGAKVIGVVLNRAVLRSHDYYYHGYYNDSYYSTPPESPESDDSNSTNA